MLQGSLTRRAVLGSLAVAPFALDMATGRAAEPSGRVVIAWHVTLPPAWFDPSTAPPQITPFGMLYAIHDALVRPYPGQKMGPSLAQSWEESEDGLTYEFKLREGLTFHNGDPVTTEDVKFSYDRYKGAGATAIKSHVKSVEVVDPRVVRFHLNAAWPDFMTFYGTTASAAGIVVPKGYISKVGDDGFKKAPVGAGPYKVVGTKPGIEVDLEAFDHYWRHVPYIKTIVMKSVPDATTRALLLKSGEADMAYALDGIDAEGIKKTPGLRVVATKHASIMWIEFPQQWDPKSPWHDKRLRLAVNYALDRQGIDDAACLGFCPPAAVIIPRVMEFALTSAKPYPYDPPKAKQLLAEAGFPNGIDAGLFTAIPGFPTVAQAVANDLNAVGIRVKLRQMERAAFYADWQAHKFHDLFLTGSGSAGNAATRVDSFIQSKGAYAYGGYPDIDKLFHEQAGERDPKKREAILDQIQQLAIDRVMYAPLYDFRALMGVGPRIADDTIGLVWMSAFPSYEDMTLKS